MSSPLVTIGMPVYNGENYLAEAIDSVLSQSFNAFRLIITDNASTDATEAIARRAERSDPRVEYHRQSANLGAAANYNFAVDLAESPYFMWQAHDDVRLPDFLERAVTAFQDNPRASVVFSRSRRIGPDGVPGSEMPRPVELTSPYAHRRLRAAITCPHPDVVLFGLMRRDMLVETGKHGAFKGGDRLLVAEMALLGEFVELPQALFLNRDHPDRYVRMADDRAHRSEKRAWWDTSEAKRISLPRWTGLWGYVKAVQGGSNLDKRQRVMAYGSIGQSLFDNRLYLLKQLSRDLLTAGFEYGHRFFRRRQAGSP